MDMGQEGQVLLAGRRMQEASYRAFHLLGQHDELRRAGVLVSIKEFPVQNPQVAIENLPDSCTPVWKDNSSESGRGIRARTVAQQFHSDSSRDRGVGMLCPHFPELQRASTHTLTFEVPNQEAGGNGHKDQGADDGGDDHTPLWAALLHLLGVHGREELHPFLQAIHVLGEEGRDGGKVDLKAWFGDVHPMAGLDALKGLFRPG